MSLSGIRIIKAGAEDYKDVVKLRDSCALGLKKMKVDQWQDKEPQLEIIKNDIASGRAYLLVKENDLLAYFYLDTADEPEYDELILPDIKGKTATLHRLMVNTEFRGRGLAQRAFSEAEDISRREGKSILFVDTHEKNKPMLRAIKKNDFGFIGFVEVEVREGHDKKRLAFSKML